MMLAGWARVLLVADARDLYRVIVIVGFHLRVVFGEEPWLARTHGAAWDEYKAKRAALAAVSVQIR